jgi:uncharacterized protein YndB with AHSA1/START domain
MKKNRQEDTSATRGLVLTADVPSDPHHVFRYLTEPDLLPRWIDGLRESRPQGDGVMRVGAKSIEVVEVRGKLVEMVSEVIALEGERVLTVRVSYPDAGDTDMTYELAPATLGTELRLTVTPRYRGLARLVMGSRFMRRATERQLQSNLDRLVHVVSASST